MYKMIIIPEEVALKIKATKFEGCEFLDPVQGEINGVPVYFLQGNVKINPAFDKVLNDFKTCEVKDIETVDISIGTKTILTVKK